MAEKSTELPDMVELSESMAGKRKAANGKADSRKWLRNKIHRMRDEGYCISTKKNTAGSLKRVHFI